MQVEFTKVKGQRVYVAEVADTTVTIKGVDDLFFIYTRKTANTGHANGMGEMIGYFDRLKDAKAAVDKVSDVIDARSR